MLREPRGYPAANCNLLLPSWDPEADAGYVIMEQVEYPGMSGTNTMCVVTVLLETGMLPMTEPVTELTLEAPAGLIRVRAECRDGKVTAVTFRNVPAFATHIAAPVEVPHLGTVTVDVAYGGMFYVIADAAAFDLRLTPDEGADIVRITEMIKAAANEQLPVVHPDQPGFAGITIGQLSGPAHDPANSLRNVVTVSTGTLDWERPATWTGAIDRSPCGTGTSAKMATLHARGELGCRRRVPPRGDPRHGLHRSGRGGDDDRGVPGDRPVDHRPSVDHRVRQLRRRPDRSVPRRLHGRRHLVVRRAGAAESMRRQGVPNASRIKGQPGSGSTTRSAVSPCSFAQAAKKATRRAEMMRGSLHEQPGTRQAGRTGGSVALWRSHLMSIAQAPFVWVGAKASYRWFER